MATETGPTTLYALAETAVGSLVHGSAYAIPTNAVRADIQIFVASVQTTSPLSPPNAIVIQGSNDASDDTQWVDLVSFTSSATASATTTANGAISAAATSVTLTGSGTFGARSTLLYFRDSSSAGEWVEAQGQSTTTLTVPAPGVVGAHSTGINIYDQALRYDVSFDVSCKKRFRVKVDNNVGATGPTLAVAAKINTYAA